MKVLQHFYNFDKLFCCCWYYIFFDNFFFMYIKIPKDASAKYYGDNKERLQKRLVKDIKVFLKKKKKNSDNMFVKLLL